MLKKMLWKVGVYSCLSERLIMDGRDSAKRVVQETIPFKFSLDLFNKGYSMGRYALFAAGKAQFLSSSGFD